MGNFAARANLIGTYRSDFPASAASGFSTGDFVEIQASGIVGGLQDRIVLKTFVIDSPFNANLVQIGASGLNASTYISDKVWNANLQNYSGVSSAGLAVNLGAGLLGIYSVQDNTPTATQFISNFIGSSGAAIDEQVLFISGPLYGQVKVPLDYNSNTRAFIFDEAFTGAPVSGNLFALISTHVHTDTEIQSLITSNSIGTVNSNVVSIGSSGLLLSTYIRDQVWNALLTNYSGINTTGLTLNVASYLSNIYSVQDNAPTSTQFISNFTGTSGSATEELVLFTAGALYGQVKTVLDYNSNTKTFKFDEAFTGSPASGDTFALISTHVHTDTEIQSLVNSSSITGTINANIVAVGGSGVTLTGVVPANLLQIGGSGINLAGVVPADMQRISGEPVAASTYVADQVWNAPTSYVTNNTMGSGLNQLTQAFYYANVKSVIGDNNQNDVYSATWYKNNAVLPSSLLANPALTVTRVDNNSQIITNKVMTFTNAVNANVFYTEPTNLFASGIPYLIIVSGLIDGNNQVWSQLTGVDIL